MSDQELRDALRALASADDVPDAEIDADLRMSVYGLGEAYASWSDADLRRAWRDGYEDALWRAGRLLDQPTGEPQTGGEG